MRKNKKDISLKKALAQGLIVDKRNKVYKVPEDLYQFIDPAKKDGNHIVVGTGSAKKSGNHIVVGGAGSGKEVGYINLQIDNAVKKMKK